MADRPRVDLYCEDSGHEQFTRALLNRIGRDLSLRLDIRTAVARGGHGAALTEFRLWQRAVVSGRGIHHEVPDLLVLVIDANSNGWAPMHRELEQSIDRAVFPRHAVGCPDPHVERWCRSVVLFRTCAEMKIGATQFPASGFATASSLLR